MTKNTHLGWNLSIFPQREMEDNAREKDWDTLLSCLPLRPKPRKVEQKMDGWMDGSMGSLTKLLYRYLSDRTLNYKQ